MGEGLFQPMHLIVIFAIALLVFGPKRLPELGKGLGEAIRGFRDSFRSGENAPPGQPSETTTAQNSRGPDGPSDQPKV